MSPAFRRQLRDTQAKVKRVTRPRIPTKPNDRSVLFVTVFEEAP